MYIYLALQQQLSGQLYVISSTPLGNILQDLFSEQPPSGAQNFPSDDRNALHGDRESGRDSTPMTLGEFDFTVLAERTPALPDGSSTNSSRSSSRLQTLMSFSEVFAIAIDNCKVNDATVPYTTIIAKSSIINNTNNTKCFKHKQQFRTRCHVLRLVYQISVTRRPVVASVQNYT